MNKKAGRNFHVQKNPRKLKRRDSTLKFSSLKVPGIIKTHTNLNIRRKLKVVTSPLLLITQYNTTAAFPVLSTE